MQTVLPDQKIASLLTSFEQILLSNSGEDAFETAVKLLAAKLLDELESAELGRPPLFMLHESPVQTHDAVQSLYKRSLIRWPALRNGGLALDINASHLTRALRPLLGWSLIGTDLSVLDITLEHLVAEGSKGALGQYFTPRDIIRLCITVLNPTAKDTVIDPACGSGGFLFESLQHCMKLGSGLPKCLGIDFSSKSVKVATLMSAALVGNPVQIFNGNSLDGRAYSEARHSEWQEFLGNSDGSKTATAESWGEWNKLGCSVLLTNPPFAGNIDDSELLSAYDAQENAKKTVSREHLFLERAVDLLKPGGRLAIVVPQGMLSNPSAAYLRSWLIKKCEVLGVVGLHSDAFQPHTGVKTAILFLSKRFPFEPTESDYPVFFAISRSPGKDSSGRKIGETDYEKLSSSFRSFLSTRKFAWVSSPEGEVSADRSYAEVMLSEIKKSDRLDAEHYDPLVRALNVRLKSASKSTIGRQVHARVCRFKRTDHAVINYADIGSIDNRTGLVFPEVVRSEIAPGRAAYIVEPGDVLVSTVRPERNVVAMVTDALEIPIVASNGLCVLRSNGVAAELLFAFCKTVVFKQLLSMQATASMYPTVSEKDILSIPFCRPPIALENEIVDEIRLGFEMLKNANAKIKRGITLMEEYLTSVKP